MDLREQLKREAQQEAENLGRVFTNELTHEVESYQLSLTALNHIIDHTITTLCERLEGELGKELKDYEKHDDHWTHCGYCEQKKSLTTAQAIIRKYKNEV